MKSILVLLFASLAASTEVEIASQTCQSNIIRARDEQKAGSKDSDFPPDATSIYWKKYPRKGGNSLKGQVNRIRKWQTPKQMKSSATLFGNSISPWDIKQGAVGTCYMLSSASSLAEWPNRVKKLFDQKDLGTSDIALTLYVKGIPKKVYVDQYLPAKSGNQPVFAKPSPISGGYWVSLLEKAYAKLNRNYEGINYGWMSEAMRTFTGAPSIQFKTKGSSSKLWSTMITAQKKDYAMTGAIMKKNRYGLMPRHAYTVIGAYQLKSGQKLVHIRNPYGFEKYRGPWSDSSREWTSSNIKEVPFRKSNDGTYFMPYEEFRKVFSWFTVTYVHDDFKVSYLDKRNAKSSDTFTINLASSGEAFIGIDVYPNRMYPDQCRGSTRGSIELYKGGKRVGGGSFSSKFGFGYIHSSKFPSGTYQMKVSTRFGSDAVKDYAIRVYSQSKA